MSMELCSVRDCYNDDTGDLYVELFGEEMRIGLCRKHMKEITGSEELGDGDILKSIEKILETPHGSRIMNLNFGHSLKDRLDQEPELDPHALLKELHDALIESSAQSVLTTKNLELLARTNYALKEIKEILMSDPNEKSEHEEVADGWISDKVKKFIGTEESGDGDVLSPEEPPSIDVNVHDLSGVVQFIRDSWVGGTPERAMTTRCGSMSLSNKDGLGRLVVDLRFPFPEELLVQFNSIPEFRIQPPSGAV